MTERLTSWIKLLVEKISGLTAAVQQQTAAIRAEGTAESTSQTDVRAGEAEMPEPFGTAVALKNEKKDKKDIDRSIDRSTLLVLENLFSIEEEEVNRPEVGAACRDLHNALNKKSRALGLLVPEVERYRNQNLRLVVCAVVLARRFGESGKEWLDQALETTRLSARTNPWSFFQTCLANGLRGLLAADLPLGQPGERNCPQAVLGRLIRKIPVPEKWLYAGSKPEAERDAG